MKFTYPEQEQFSAEYFEQFNGNLTSLGERPLVKKFARKQSDRLDSVFKHNSVEYGGLSVMGTDEMFEILLMMGKRKPRRLDWFVKKTGKDPEYLEKLLQNMAESGLIEYDRENEDREKQYWVPPYVEGQGEWAVINKDRLAAHPELGEFFTNNAFMPIEQIAPMVAPGGGGTGMHIVPVEKAIENNSECVDIERLSHWLNKYDKFCSAPCACRNARRQRGEGSPEDPGWCLFIGDFADYMMETKKALRYVTREEALEICRMAEDHGFIHQVTNQDGSDKIFCICNCNIETCYSLRCSQLFNTPNTNASAYRARVDKEKCVACGQCVEVCPAGAAKLGQKLCTKTGPISYPVVDLPDDHIWGKNRRNYDYRDTNRIQVYDTGTAPCKTACPAHIGIQGYLKLAAQGKYDEALELIKKDNPFPAICGRVCNRRCEDACTRGTVDDPVAIDEVKNFLAQRDLDAETRYIPKKLTGNIKEECNKEKIAIIGAGPAGLSCAYYLALWGYLPTVFDKNPQPGGMMRYGIPSFRLEKDVVAAEIDILRELGVDIRCGVEVGKDVTIQELRDQGYKGFYVAIGLQNGGKLGIPGDDSEGVMSGIEFTKMVNTDGPEKHQLKGKVVVIGGGNIGADVARTAVRAGAESVDLYCLEAYDEMPMGVEDRTECEEDGIVIHAGWGQTEVKAVDGKCASISFRKCLSVRNAEGRFAPTFDDADTAEQECSTVLYCIGQRTDWGELLKGTKVEFNPNGTAKAHPKTYQTAEPDIFVGGDAYTGQKFAIDAIAAGRFGADSLRRYVQEGVNMITGRDWRELKELDKDNIAIPAPEMIPRQQHGTKAGISARTSFRDARMTFTEEQVKQETARCLSCGATVVDENKCIGCGICTTRCKFDAIHLHRTHPEHSNMVPYEQRNVMGIKHQIKRVGTIAAKDIKVLAKSRARNK